MALNTPNTTRRGVLGLTAATMLGAGTDTAHAAAAGQMVCGFPVTLAPAWLDPAETPGIITPFILLYALHDAVVKPMPGNPVAPCLAESYTAAADGLSYTFVLRAGAKFHNGETVTAEDVKFSFERYRGNAASLMKQKVAAVETPDARHVIFRLHKPWLDFLTYYSSASAAGWVVPKKYLESVGEDGFKKAPIGAGPYKFVSSIPGIELVLEAFEDYWRKPPTMKKLVFKVRPDLATRFAALKVGELDLASLDGDLATELLRTPGLTLQPTVIVAPFWVYFPDQWDPQSPWFDARVRQAVTLALDRDGMNQALALGHCLITGSIVPKSFEYYWQPPKIPFDPTRARALLAEAGFPNGFDGGDYHVDAQFAYVGEVVVNNLREVGIRLKLRPLERAAFFKAFAEKKLKNVVQGSSGAFGNAASRMETFIVKGGAFVYGSYPDIDALFAQQEEETDRARREAILHRMQQLVHERTICAPLWQLAVLIGLGRRVEYASLGKIAGFPWPAPWDDVRLKSGA